ncbi:ATP-binding protein [Streptomyces sp. NPDC060198]|uniref:ATP-binding protein n=1 Tax=Streptomyces sp. NPDC060198 TaxID=3347070 RepID=UPI00364DE90C
MTVITTPRPTGHPGYSVTLPREPRSAPTARGLVRTALTAWGVGPESIDDGTLILSELVSNAVQHARLTSMRVLVTRPTLTTVVLGVVDRSTSIPLLRTDSNGDQVQGRGLLLVDALSDRWGTELYRWGKQVWSELGTEADS